MNRNQVVDWRVFFTLAWLLSAFFLLPSQTLAAKGNAPEIILFGDRVWQDWNGNGLLDDGPYSGLAGVVVTLYKDDGDGLFEPGAGDVLLMQTVTDAGGGYTLHSSASGSYWVDVDRASVDGLQATAGAQSAPPPRYVTASGGQILDDIDFGFSAVGSLWGTVYYDVNMDGMQGLGESGVPDAIICLYSDANDDGLLDAGDPQLVCVHSDAQGHYFFRDLFYGSYIIEELDAPGVGHIGPAVKSVHLDPWKVSALELPPFADVLLAHLSGRLFIDSNANGVVDAGESAGVEGATVLLMHQASGQLVRATTQAGGFYRFKDLWPGEYVILAAYSAAGYVLGAPAVQSLSLSFGENLIDMNIPYSPASVQPPPGDAGPLLFTPLQAMKMG